MPHLSSMRWHPMKRPSLICIDEVVLVTVLGKGMESKVPVD